MLASFSSGCESIRQIEAAVVPVVVTRCPAHKDGYPPETAKKLGAELSGLLARDSAAVAPGVVRDYRTLLAECKAVEKK